MGKDTSKITLEEIAEMSGVSISTVSRVINNSRSVGRDSETKVRKAMEDLGVKPQERIKPRQRPPSVIMIMPDTDNPALAKIEAGARKEAERLGFSFLIVRLNDEPWTQNPSIHMLSHIPVDAIIIRPHQIDPTDVRGLCGCRSIPVVVLERIMQVPYVHSIDTNRESGMYQATKYLLNLNHRNVAYIAAHMGEFSIPPLRGVQRALYDAGLSLDTDFLRWCAPSIEGGFQAASSFLQGLSGKRPSAILVYSDFLAIGVMHAVQTLGFKIPQDISVVGFDNNCFSLHMNPPLTTVAHPQQHMGQLAVKKVHEMLSRKADEQEGFTLLECPLMVRKSTGPCKMEGSFTKK